MKRVSWLVLAILALMPLVVACAVDQRSDDGLPDYAYRSESALKGYRTAVQYRTLLKRLPCYCGCGKDPSFTNLADCFFNSQSDKQGEFNSHAANCAVCLEEAEDAAKWHEQGMSLAQIRQSIDDKYRERGPATDTPAIAPGEEIVP